MSLLIKLMNIRFDQPLNAVVRKMRLNICTVYRVNCLIRSLSTLNGSILEGTTNVTKSYFCNF
jgi:hypothetical protein